MYTEDMSKVFLYGRKNDMERIIKILHREKVYHISEPKENNGAMPLSRAEEVADTLNKVRAILSFLDIKNKVKEDKITSDDSDSIKEISKSIDKIHEELSKISKDKNMISEKISKIDEDLKTISNFKGSPLFGSNIGELDNVKILFLKADENFEEKVREKTDKYEIWANGKYFVLAYDKKIDLSDALKSATIFNLEMPLDKTTERLKEEKKKLSGELEDIEKKISSYSRLTGKLLSYEKELKKELEKLEAPLKFSHLDRSFYISGYMPTKKVAHLKTVLDDEIGQSYYLVEEIVPRKEEAPVKLNNKRIVSPFEFFLHLYSLPKYSEIDPSSLIFITFPIIFGAMLGDIGYGITTLAIFIILRSKMPKAKDFFDILIWSSLWTIVFGFFFGEFFGAEEIAIGSTTYVLPHVIGRLHEINKMIAFSITIGLIHINLGLILGFINVWKKHGFKEAFFEKISWIIIQAGAGMLGYGLVNRSFMVPGTITLTLGIIFLYIGEGMHGLIELPGIFGNILSYARIMAIGLASAGLAVVVNDFATNFFSKGSIGGAIAAILLLLVGHTINILLGIIGPFLHSLRLHYVEEFTKFYKGGGKAYKPFGEDIE